MEVRSYDRPLLSFHPNKKNMHSVLNDFKVYFSDGSFVLIKRGTNTNGLTLPDILVWLYPIVRVFIPRWHPHYSLAVVVHDGLVSENGSPTALYCKKGEVPREMSWEESSEVMESILVLSECPLIKRKVIKASVDLWGKLKRFIGA